MNSKYIPFLFLILLSAPAHAYIGPGMGAGVIASILGVIASVFLSLFAIIYYHIKRVLKMRKNRTLPKEVAENTNERN
jgi:hypothetical protein